jgi:hypothetical protein
MRCHAHYDDRHHPPLLKLSVFDAPHRRMHIAVIKQYRQCLYEAIKRALEMKGVSLPIDWPIDLSVLFVNPSSPDLGNLFLALEQALDGKTLTKKNMVLTDDSLVSKVTMGKLYPFGPVNIAS